MDGVKDPTLEPADGDKFLQRELRKLVMSHYKTLASATIQVFWAETTKPLTWWGNVKVATEELWILASVDIVIQINHALWEALDPDGQKGLLAHFLWQVQAKAGTTTIQRHDKGDRNLYSARTSTMKVAPEVLARHPKLVSQLEELRDFRGAIDDPNQFLLDLEMKRTEPDDVAAAA